MHSNNAIKIAQDIKESIEQTIGFSAADLMKAKRILSDRKGNLAVIYLEQNRFVESFRLLEMLLLHDRDDDYVTGTMTNLGTLGHYYLKQGEISSAERTFLGALNYVR